MPIEFSIEELKGEIQNTISDLQDPVDASNAYNASRIELDIEQFNNGIKGILSELGDLVKKANRHNTSNIEYIIEKIAHDLDVVIGYTGIIADSGIKDLSGIKGLVINIVASLIIELHVSTTESSCKELVDSLEEEKFYVLATRLKMAFEAMHTTIKNMLELVYDDILFASQDANPKLVAKKDLSEGQKRLWGVFQDIYKTQKLMQESVDPECFSVVETQQKLNDKYSQTSEQCCDSGEKTPLQCSILTQGEAVGEHSSRLDLDSVTGLAQCHQAGTKLCKGVGTYSI